MDGGRYATGPDWAATAAELAATDAKLPYSQRRAVWDYWERVLANCRVEAARAPRPTSALLDGSAAERRRCRMERRALAAVVRVLPVRQQAEPPSGSDAA